MTHTTRKVGTSAAARDLGLTRDAISRAKKIAAIRARFISCALSFCFLGWGEEGPDRTWGLGGGDRDRLLSLRERKRAKLTIRRITPQYHLPLDRETPVTRSR
jgi:hypothetical protein